MRKRATHQQSIAVWGDEPVVARPEQIGRATALRSVGTVVYAVQVGALIKIGYTSNLQHRLHSLSGTLLAFRPGTLADELRAHEILDGHQHHGREWYYPTRQVMEFVNEMRADLGMEPVAA